jgi:cytochrome c-type biogenesis protein
MDPENEEASDVVDKTLAFMEREWWDASAGGFWGNSDVHGEDAYFGQDPRPSPSPRVERTKYTDWNSEAVVTFLHLWNATGNTTHRDMARRTLDFLIEEMVTNRGVFHFMDENGTKGVRGSLLDDAYLLLACMDGYTILGDERYLDTARQLGDNALDHLYDWHGGGFFERNSPDTHLYAPGEDIRLAKPPAENGIMAYALLRLHVATDEMRYLITGLRTMGAMRNETLVLDTGYYHVLAANLVLDHGLLTEHDSIRNTFQKEEQERREGFWLDSRLGPVPTVMPSIQSQPLEDTTSVLEGPPFEPPVSKAPLTILLIVALIAGLISFASPCTLAILPAYLAFTLRANQKGLRAMTLAFLLGMISTFTLLGMSATAMGIFLQTNVIVFSKAAGLAIIAFGLYIITGGNFAGPRMTVHGPASAAGAFLFGAAMGISWTPCVGPVLVSILILASTTTSVGSGGMLLFAYGCGLAIPLVIVSFYLDSIDRDGRFWRALRGREIRVRLFGRDLAAHTTALVSGLLFLLIGTLMLTDNLIALNRLLSVTWVQGWVYGAEERLLAFAGWS